METTTPADRLPISTLQAAGPEARSSGMSWGAVLGGAFVAAALALLLLLLGSGLGFTVVSPWANEGASAKTLGIAALAWMIVTHFASSAMGGYMAGRLRTKWVDVRTDEVFFRDTAHGLVTWAVGIVPDGGTSHLGSNVSRRGRDQGGSDSRGRRRYGSGRGGAGRRAGIRYELAFRGLPVSFGSPPRGG